MIALLSGLALAGPLAAESTGDIRFIGSQYTDFPVHAEGSTVGQGFVVDQRFRLGGAVRAGDDFRAVAELDLFTGQVVGDPWDLSVTEDERERHTLGAFDTERIVLPRKLHVGGRLAGLDLQAGLDTSHWGLGMVANDGAHEPLFGRSDFGDRVLRTRLLTAPLSRNVPIPWFIVVAGDYVIADDLMRASNGQRAMQGILSTFWTEGEGKIVGIYAVIRHQVEPDGRLTDVVVLDASEDWTFDLGHVDLRIGSEAVGVTGRTSRALSYNARDQLKVRTAGLATHLALGDGGGLWTSHFRAGWASGDGNPDDDTTHDFSFDRDFDAGMVLFDEVGGAIDAGTYELLTDPQYSAEPPDGVDGLVSEGAFRRASFLQTAFEVDPTDWLDLRVGSLVGWQSGPVAQPFYTFRAGGTPTNHADAPTDGYFLGTEVDWSIALSADPDDEWAAMPSLQLQGGHALLGDNLVARGGPATIHLITATGRVRW